MELVDFNNAEMLMRVYGGNAGRKICVKGHDGAPWMLKFPEPTLGMRGNLPSYTTSPISEWLGSHIYALLGIPVHETVLGFREGKVVCACKDFTWPDLTLMDFHDMKNTLSDDLWDGFENRPSDGRSLYLSDVLAGIRRLGDMVDVDEVLERFWDMFVVDAFIGNADRNNENWGFLARNGALIGLAPVYDNGNAFFNKRQAETTALRLSDDNALDQDAIGGARSCYLKDNGHPLAPLKYISSAADANCNAALLRFVERLDLAAVDDLIDSLPEEFLNFTVMPAASKEFHKEVLHRRYETCLLPAAKAIGTR